MRSRDWWLSLALYLLLWRGLIALAFDLWRVLAWFLYY